MRESSAPWRPGNTPVVLREPDCNVVEPKRKVDFRFGDAPEVGTVHLDGEAIPLRMLGLEAERPPGSYPGAGTIACRKAPIFGPASLHTFLLTEGDTCIVGVLNSEVTIGTLGILEKGQEVLREFLPGRSPRHLFHMHGRRIVLWEGAGWGISRVLRESDGTWRVEPAIDRSGVLFGYAFDARQRLLLRVLEPTRQWCGTNWRLYRLMEDGRLEVIG